MLSSSRALARCGPSLQRQPKLVHWNGGNRSFFSFRNFSAMMADDEANPNTSSSPKSATKKAPTKATSNSVSSSSSSSPPPSPQPAKKSLEELPVTFSDISRARVNIRGGVVRTTCEKSYFLSELVGANVYLKTEFRQFTGSFKERGARNAIINLLREHGDEFRKTGVIAASAGNHALALAYHGKELGVPVTVVMPTVAPLAKVDKCKVNIAWHVWFCVCLCSCSCFDCRRNQP